MSEGCSASLSQKERNDTTALLIWMQLLLLASPDPARARLLGL